MERMGGILLKTAAGQICIEEQDGDEVDERTLSACMQRKGLTLTLDTNYPTTNQVQCSTKKSTVIHRPPEI